MGPIPVIDVAPLFNFPPDGDKIQVVSQAIGDACKGAPVGTKSHGSYECLCALTFQSHAFKMLGMRSAASHKEVLHLPRRLPAALTDKALFSSGVTPVESPQANQRKSVAIRMHTPTGQQPYCEQPSVVRGLQAWAFSIAPGTA